MCKKRVKTFVELIIILVCTEKEAQAITLKNHIGPEK